MLSPINAQPNQKEDKFDTVVFDMGWFRTALGQSIHVDSTKDGMDTFDVRSGDTVEVKFIEGKDKALVKFKGKRGYMSKDLFNTYPHGSWVYMLQHSPVKSGILINHSKWLAFLLAIIGFGLFFNRISESPLDSDIGSIFIPFVHLPLLFITFILDIFLFLGYQGNPTWFCSPTEVGWLWGICGTIFAPLAIGAQIIMFRISLKGIDEIGNRTCEWAIGIVSIPFYIIVKAILNSFFPTYEQYADWGFYAIQFIQIGFCIYTSFSSKCNIGVLLLSLIFYSLGVFSLKLMLSSHLLLCVFSIYALFLMFGRPEEICKNCTAYLPNTDQDKEKKQKGYCKYHRKDVYAEQTCEKYLYTSPYSEK